MKQAIKECVVTFLVVAGLMFALAGVHGLATAPAAGATPGIGCETIRWGFLGLQRRTVCDGPRQADGTWLRAREIWSPARYQPGYCSSYYCSAGYPVAQATQAFETYPVTDGTVLPDEPPWMPAGTVIIR